MSLHTQHSHLLKTLDEVGCPLDKIIVKKKQDTLFNAYKVKSEMRKNASREQLQPAYVIKTSDPIRPPHEGKYTHVRGAHINPISNSSSRKELQFEEPPLANSNSKPFLIEHHEHQKVYDQLNQRETIAFKSKRAGDKSNDLTSDPKKVIKLLQGTRVADLNFPTHSADFTSEVMWRLQLRN